MSDLDANGMTSNALTEAHEGLDAVLARLEEALDELFENVHGLATAERFGRGRGECIGGDETAKLRQALQATMQAAEQIQRTSDFIADWQRLGDSAGDPA